MDYRIGFPEKFRFLDDEHEVIGHDLAVLKTGSSEDAAQRPKVFARQILRNLQDHMAHEESVMRQHDYPDYGLHRKHHEALVYAFETILNFFDVGGISDHRGPIVQHIENKIREEMFADRLLARFLDEHSDPA